MALLTRVGIFSVTLRMSSARREGYRYMDFNLLCLGSLVGKIMLHKSDGNSRHCYVRFIVFYNSDR